MTAAGLSNLVVEVLHWRDDDNHPYWSVGSGFFVGSRLVLTASHSVDGPGELLVRVHGTEEHPAVVRLQGDNDIVDLAVLEVSDVAVDVPPLRYGAVDRSAPAVVERCWAVGFPRFKERVHDPKPLRLSAQVNGEIPTGENLDQLLLTLQVRRSPRPLSSSAVRESEWAGMSGATVFSGNNIIVGVITEHFLPEGESALTVVPITALDLLPEAEATKWWKLLGVDHRTLVRLPGEAPSSLSHVERHQPRQLNVKALPSSKRAKQVVKRQPGEAKSGSAGQADKGASVLPSQSVQFTLARALTGHLDGVHSIAISPDGQTLATCSSDNTKLWNLHTGKRLRTMKMTRSLSIEHIVISSDGHLLSSGGQSLPIKIWNPHTGELLRTIDIEDGVDAIAFSPVGPILASSDHARSDGKNQSTRLWNPHTGELLRTLRSSDDITCLVFSPDGQILACGGLETSKESGSRWVERGSTWKERRGLITLWNPYTGKLLRTITGNTERSFTFVVFSPDGQLLASSDSSLENSVALWNPYTGEHFRTIPSIHPASKFDKLLGYIPRGKAIAFSPDGQLLASDDDISDGIIELWNPHTGELVGTIPWQPGLEHSRLIAFSPDGQLLVCGNINIWKKTNAT